MRWGHYLSNFYLIKGTIMNRSQKHLLVIFVALFATTLVHAQWVDQISGAGNLFTTAAAVDQSNNVYITGYFGGTADFDPGAGVSNITSAGNSDIFIAKYNSSGALQWVKAIGGTSDDESNAIAVDFSGNVYITGDFQGTADFDPSGSVSNLVSAGGKDIFFAKYNTSGAYVWTKNVGALVDDVGNAITTDGGGVYIGGTYTGDADFDPGAGSTILSSTGAFFAEYDASNGAYLWAKAIPGAMTNLHGIALDGAGLVHIVGEFTGTVDFDPSASTYNLTATGSTDGFVAQYDNTANIQWAIRISGTAYNSVNGIAIDDNGDVSVTGKFEETTDFDPGAGTVNKTSAGFSDFFVAKYNANGIYQWVDALGGTGIDVGKAITVDASRNIYATGANVGHGSYFAKLNSAGTVQWGNPIGNTVDYSRGIGVDGSGNVYVTGYFAGTVDFDPGAGTLNLTSVGPHDLYVGKYQNGGALPVELSSFEAVGKIGSVQLQWTTASELNNYGFEIERRYNDSSPTITDQAIEGWGRIGFVEGAGNSNSSRKYSFVDYNSRAGTYSYRLKQIDRDGKFEYSKTVQAEISLPHTLTLSQNYPNPFNPSTTIEFTLPDDGRVSLKVFDVLGKVVATLVDVELKADAVHRATFDASNVSSGIYFFRLEYSASGGNAKQLMKKLLVMK